MTTDEAFLHVAMGASTDIPSRADVLLVFAITITNERIFDYSYIASKRSSSLARFARALKCHVVTCLAWRRALPSTYHEPHLPCLLHAIWRKALGARLLDSGYLSFQGWMRFSSLPSQTKMLALISLRWAIGNRRCR